MIWSMDIFFSETKVEDENGCCKGDQEIPRKPPECFHKDGILIIILTGGDCRINPLKFNPGNQAG